MRVPAHICVHAVVTCAPTTSRSPSNARTGEPKSGTALMFHGANGALAHACDFLNKWFGDGSCRLEGQDYNGRHHTPPHIGLTFDPQLGKTNALCPCDGVDR